ncbi:MAG: dTMP kinase [Chloroflexota bacterium]
MTTEARTGTARFVTIEGPDGAGKTSQAAALAEHLRGRGIETVLTREPGGTTFGERLRGVLLDRAETGGPSDPLADAFLFNAARRQLVREVIVPSLGRGATVICARFADSTLAYQGFGAGVPLATLRSLQDTATDGLMPDLTILLEVPPDVGLGRKSSDELTRFEADFDLAFHRRVRDGFLQLAADEPDRFVVVDATRDPAAVQAAIRAAVAARFTLPGEPRRPRARTPG